MSKNSVVFETEPEEANVMKIGPRSIDKKLFDRNAAIVSFLQGAFSLFAVVIVFVTSLGRGFDENAARTMAFATIVFANLALILVNRSWSQTILSTFRRRNNSLFWIFGLTLFALGLTIYATPVSSLFRLSALQLTDLLICLASGFLSVAWFELFKVFKKRVKV